ncbi:hypothetical protein BGX21_000408 [Mortierella sp. AD011]|nr:hypothetical protein BGX20_001117 [Mortierella sp. AD010]KAF9388021.1 hypothetical protein BGX21_000408 [Mortierella sp. AD011]
MSALSSIVNTNTSPKGKPVSTPTVTNGTSASTGVSQVGQSIENNKNTMTSTTADDIKYKRKYKDLKKRIRDIEEDNDILNIKLSRARKNIHRLRVERRLDHSENAAHPSASSSSTSDSDTDDERNEGDGDGSKSHRNQHRHGIDRLKRFRHSYSHSGHHGRHDSSHSQSLPASSGTTLSNHHNARSKTPPSRASSVPRGSAHHSASSSLSQITDPSQVASLSSSSVGAGKRANAVQKKRRKDPLAPKRPSNAFFIFSQQHRQQARDEKKEGNQSELTKFLGQQWKSMPPTEKKIYSDLASQDRKRYQEEMILYEHEHGQGNTGLLDFSQKQSKKAPGKVGRPSKYDKYSAELKALNGTSGGDNDNTNNSISSNSSNNGENNNINGTDNNLLVTTSNGHGSSVTKKMEILSMMNGEEGEGEDMMTSHDEEEDARMGDGGSEEDHDEDGEDDDDIDEDPEDDDDDDEATKDGGLDATLEGAIHNGIAYSRHGEDVDMVDAHRSQGPGLIASA